MTLTEDHLLPYGPCTSKASEYEVLLAADLKTGDCLRTVSGTDRVLSIDRRSGFGVYTVVVDNEFLVVNGGILASPFNRNHNLARLFYSLYSFAFHFAPNLMSASTGFGRWLHDLPAKLDVIGQFIPVKLF